MGSTNHIIVFEQLLFGCLSTYITCASTDWKYTWKSCVISKIIPPSSFKLRSTICQLLFCFTSIDINTSIYFVRAHVYAMPLCTRGKSIGTRACRNICVGESGWYAFVSDDPPPHTHKQLSQLVGTTFARHALAETPTHNLEFFSDSPRRHFAHICRNSHKRMN